MPAFNGFLSIYGIVHIPGFFAPDKVVNVVARGEAPLFSYPMLDESCGEIIGDTGVENSFVPIREDISPETERAHVVQG